MGQTLTHGVYLPDEGERNCYNGLAANWSILDGAVGTIAEHSTQIAGKAPLAHTHGNLTNDGKVGTTANKPLITGTGGVVQAGSFGNSASTFCEGNDSRLSDARTPVAHTHTKSDVTDLLNSNFIPSANTTYDLGSSSYQWNNLYAKNYYYNGVAWGLDKSNVWRDSQTVLKNSEALYVLKRSNLKLGDPIPQNTQILGTFAFTGSDGANAGIVTFRDGSNGDTSLIILARQKYNSNGDRDPSGFQYETRMDIGIDSSRNRYIRPNSNGDIDLGTSTNKWKTLNGVNPGALSLPRSASVNIDTTNWNLRGGTICAITAPVDTYICVQIRRNVKFDLWVIGTGRQTTTAVITSNDGYYRAMIMIPCAAGNVMSFYTQPLVDTPEEDRDPDLAIDYAKYFYCLGNV